MNEKNEKTIKYVTLGTAIICVLTVTGATVYKRISKDKSPNIVVSDITVPNERDYTVDIAKDEKGVVSVTISDVLEETALGDVMESGLDIEKSEEVMELMNGDYASSYITKEGDKIPYFDDFFEKYASGVLSADDVIEQLNNYTWEEEMYDSINGPVIKYQTANVICKSWQTTNTDAEHIMWSVGHSINREYNRVKCVWDADTNVYTIYLLSIGVR